MKNTLLMALLCLLANGLFAQQRTCGSTKYYQQQLDNIPNFQQARQQIERQTRTFQAKKQQQRTNGIITIPVVVHVLYHNTTTNISDAQIHSQIQVLNDDYRRMNADADATWPQAADTEIEFCLASVAPDGTATTGITRTSTSITEFGAETDNMKYTTKGGMDAWPSTDYLNMWICGIGDGTLGYAQFPGGPAATDGVVMDAQYFGTMGTAVAPFDLGRTTTHEVGHWLNLFHIWGDGNCSEDDLVADTPSSNAANYDCELNHTSCSSKDMVQNYMDYSDDACMNLFTEGQKTRMQALFATGGPRASLLNSNGCGIPNDGGPSCTEVTLSIKLDDFPGETSWELTDASAVVLGSGNNYSGSTVTKTFCLEEGCYDFTINDSYGDGICCAEGNGSYTITSGGVTLASGGDFASTETKEFCIETTTPPTNNCPALDFNDYTFSGYGGSQDKGTYSIQDGGATVFLEGNAWKKFVIDYTVTANTVIEFDFKSTIQAEVHAIGFDNDNSLSQTRTFKVHGTQKYGLPDFDNYVDNGQYQHYTIPVGEFYTGDFNRIFFSGDHDAGAQNGTAFFSNLKIYEGSCGAKATAPKIKPTQQELSVFPNPTNGLLNVSYEQLEGERTHFRIIDGMGRTLIQREQTTEKGINLISLSLEDLANGTYFLVVNAGDAQQTKRFVILK